MSQRLLDSPVHGWTNFSESNVLKMLEVGLPKLFVVCVFVVVRSTFRYTFVTLVRGSIIEGLLVSLAGIIVLKFLLA